MPNIPTPGVKRSDFLLSEAHLYRSRQEVPVTVSGTAIKSGTIMQSAARADASVAAVAGMVGAGSVGTVTVGNGAKPGLYRVIMTGSGATAAFDVYDPDGTKLTAGAVGSAYSQGGIGFTIADGNPDFAVNDEIHINVDVGELTYAPYAGGTVGGVLYNDIPAYTGEMRAVMMVRDCEVMRAGLIGLTKAAETALEALGIIVCGVYDN